MRKPSLVILSLAAGVALAGAVAAPAVAAPVGKSTGSASAAWSRAPKPQRVDGTVGAVDAAASTLTLVRPGKADLVATVTAGAEVEIDEVAATLADVPTGARVWVRGAAVSGVFTTGKVVVTTTWPLRVDGTVAAVDESSVTVGSTAYPVDEAATITVDRAAATLADVPVGARVRVAGTVTNGVPSVTSVAATTSWAFAVDGLVAAVDGTAGTLTVRTGRTSTATVPVDPAAKVTLNGRPVAVANVPAGAAVRVTGVETLGVRNATRVLALKPRAKR